MKSIGAWIGKLNLWPQVALTISIGFLVLYIAFFVLDEQALQDSSHRILDERLLIAQMAASQIDQWLQEEIDELQQANIRADFDPLDPNLEAEVDLLAYTYKNLNEFSPGFVLLDPGGQVIISRPANLYLPGTNISHLPHIATALALREPTISAPFNDPINNLPVIALTVPIYDGDQLKGLLCGLVDFERSEVLSPLDLAKTLSLSEHAILVDSEGRTLASTFELPFLSPGEHFTFYRQALAQGKPIVETVPFELDLPGEPKDHLHVMAIAPLQSMTWGVAVGGDRDETFASVNRLRVGLFVVGTLALGAVWGGTLIGTHRLVRPIQEMTRAAQQIAQGDLQTNIRASGGNEIKILASALENMRVQMLSYIEKLTNWNQALEERVEKRTTELRQEQALTRQLLRQVINAQEEERARIARELHDELGQRLTAIKINLDRSSNASSPTAVAGQGQQLEIVRELTDETIIELRRLIAAMRPGVLDKLGLVSALDWIGRQIMRPTEVEVKIEADSSFERLPDEIETTLFRIAQEAMNNVARHSQAQHVIIRLQREIGLIKLTISDDGQGWEQTTTPIPGEGNKMGLVIMRERAMLVGGQLEIESTPNQGTTVRVVIPIPVNGGNGNVTPH